MTRLYQKYKMIKPELDIHISGNYRWLTHLAWEQAK